MKKSNHSQQAKNSVSRLWLGVSVFLLAFTLWTPQARAFDVALDVVPEFFQLVGARSSISAVLMVTTSVLLKTKAEA